MKPRLIIFGFFGSIAILILSSLYLLKANKQIIKSFEQGEARFQIIATAATEVSSYAKRAEGHLFLYLVLNRDSDRERFPLRIASLNEQIFILENNIQNSQAKNILTQIKEKAQLLSPIGNSLIELHDQALEEKKRFPIEDHQDTIFQLHDYFSEVRKLGVELAIFEIKLENHSKLEALTNVERMRFYILLFTALAALCCLYLGFLLINLIEKLRHEIAQRSQSEQKLEAERAKLEQALAQVKLLSGMLPICSNCKKIRDDQGNWNHIENFIKERSEAEFTHGFCPECAQKLYPELSDSPKDLDKSDLKDT